MRERDSFHNKDKIQRYFLITKKHKKFFFKRKVKRIPIQYELRKTFVVFFNEIVYKDFWKQ